MTALEDGVHEVLASWHYAARAADEELFFGMMADDAVFVGTDNGEVWSKEAFRAASKTKFQSAPAWSVHAKEMHLCGYDPLVGLVWFVELLDSEGLGPCRGSGVVKDENGVWKVALYVLSFSVPNEAIAEIKPIVESSLGVHEIDLSNLPEPQFLEGGRTAEEHAHMARDPDRRNY